MKYIVELESGVWIADTDGDPGRTLVESHAKTFTSLAEASKSLMDARNYRTFENASIRYIGE